MESSDIPNKIYLPWGSYAGSGYIRSIPAASQLPGDPGRASFSDGFPPATFLTVASGGAQPDGRDMNGVLKAISEWSRWIACGGPVKYDAVFQAQIGGYPEGAIVESLVTQAAFWYSTVDDNLTDPDNSGAGWVSWPNFDSANRWTLIQSGSLDPSSTIPQTYSDLLLLSENNVESTIVEFSSDGSTYHGA